MDKVRTLQGLQSASIRGIVDEANRMGLQKEDILQILTSNGEYFLLYYK